MLVMANLNRIIYFERSYVASSMCTLLELFSSGKHRMIFIFFKFVLNATHGLGNRKLSISVIFPFFFLFFYTTLSLPRNFDCRRVLARQNTLTRVTCTHVYMYLLNRKHIEHTRLYMKFINILDIHFVYTCIFMYILYIAPKPTRFSRQRKYTAWRRRPLNVRRQSVCTHLAARRHGSHLTNPTIEKSNFVMLFSTAQSTCFY